MVPEPYEMAPEPFTKATQIWEFSLSCLAANATRRRIALQNCSGLVEEDTVRLAFYVAR